MNCRCRQNDVEISEMLLYAMTNEDIQLKIEYVMSCSRISVKTLDLNGEFGNQKNQLDEIILKYFGEITDNNN